MLTLASKILGKQWKLKNKRLISANKTITPLYEKIGQLLNKIFAIYLTSYNGQSIK